MPLNLVPITAGPAGSSAQQTVQRVAPLNVPKTPYKVDYSPISQGMAHLVQALKDRKYMDSMKRYAKEEGIPGLQDMTDPRALKMGIENYQFGAELTSKKELLEYRLEQREIEKKHHRELMLSIQESKSSDFRYGVNAKTEWNKLDNRTKTAIAGESDETKRWLGTMTAKNIVEVMKMKTDHGIALETLKGKNAVQIENIRITADKDKFERENPILHGQVMERVDAETQRAVALQDSELQSEEFLELGRRTWQAGQNDNRDVYGLLKQELIGRQNKALQDDRQVYGGQKDVLLHKHAKELKNLEHTFESGKQNKNITHDMWKTKHLSAYGMEKQRLIESRTDKRHTANITHKEIMQDGKLAWLEKSQKLAANTELNRMRTDEEIQRNLNNQMAKLKATESALTRKWKSSERIQTEKWKDLNAETVHHHKKAEIQQSLYGEEAHDIRLRKTKIMMANINNEGKQNVARIQALASENKLNKTMGIKLRNSHTSDSKEFRRVQNIMMKIDGALKGPQSNISDKALVQNMLNMVQQAGKGSTKMYKTFESSGMIGELHRLWNDLTGKESRIPHGQVRDLYKTAWDIFQSERTLYGYRRRTSLEQAKAAGIEKHWITNFDDMPIKQLTPEAGTGEFIRWKELAGEVQEDFQNFDPGALQEQGANIMNNFDMNKLSPGVTVEQTK